MAKLKDISVLETAKPKKKGKEVATLTFEGDMARRYNEAADQIATALAVQKELAPLLIDAGCQYVFETNCVPGAKPINSVNLVDDSLSTVMVTWTRKPKAMDAEAVEAFFEGRQTLAKKLANVNDYAAFVPVAAFDAKVFMVLDTKGKPKFSQARYDAFNTAMLQVAEQFEVTNPLSCSKVFAIQPDFQERRFEDFDADTNMDLMEVMPTSVSLESVRSQEGDA